MPELRLPRRVPPADGETAPYGAPDCKNPVQQISRTARLTRRTDRYAPHEHRVRPVLTATAILGFATVALAGCITANRDAPAAPSTPAVISQIREVDLSARFPQSQPAANAIGPSGSAQAQSYYGEEGRSTIGARPR